MTALFTIWALLLSLGAHASADDLPVWLGVDYRLASWSGPEFTEPDRLCPHYLQKWNRRVPLQLEALLKRTLGEFTVDIAPINALHDQAPPPSSSSEPHPPFPDTTLAAWISQWPVPEGPGTAVLMVVESLDSHTERACVHLAVIDRDSQDMRTSFRTCADAHGEGVYNRWFKPLDTALRQHRRDLRDALRTETP